jgi:DnaJ family protein C protein 7
MLLALSLPENRSLAAGKVAEAVNYYHAALHVDPDHHIVNKQLWLGLCGARRQLGKFDEALEACDAALTLEPNWGDAVHERLQVLVQAERWDEAVAKAKEAASTFQGDMRFRQVKGLEWGC